MLKELKIHNYVLIKELALKPSPNLNIITGETGAGKSILIGALGLLLGKRADPKLIQEPDKKCIVEGHFNVQKKDLSDVFQNNDIDYDDYTIIRREILPNGRSRAFVNDTPVSLQVLQEIGDKLVDIHSQHQNLNLNQPSFLFDWLDAIAGQLEERSAYSETYGRLCNMRDHLQVLLDAQARQSNERDYWQFLFDELEQANLVRGEMDDLNSRIDLLANAEDVKEAAILGVNSIDEQENNVLDRLLEIQNNWPQAVRNNPEITKINERLESVIVELKELVSDLRNLTNSQDSEPEELEQLNARMTEIQLLLRKHRMQTDEELLNFKDDLDNKLLMVDTREQEILDLQKDIELVEKNAREQATRLHAKRFSEAKNIVGNLEEKLKLLGLPHAQIEIKVSEKSSLNSFGYTELQLLFSANKGARLEEVQKSASGGEVSRLMLVLKSQLARHRHLPTVIFDEIDTGVSGEVGLRMGEMMEELSHDLQVISITHLPQIASKGGKHFSVYKSHEGAQSQTEVVALQGESRILEIAKMLSGNVPTDGALANARELLGGES